MNKAICRELGVSRKVVRKVIRSEATEFRYERETQPLPKMGPWSAELDRLLAANESKAARERLTLIRLFEELRGLGYAGGYDAVRRYARRWSRERGASTASAYVPLSFAPGEAYQFDWSHEVVLLSGVTVIVKAAHVRPLKAAHQDVEVLSRHSMAQSTINVLGLPEGGIIEWVPADPKEKMTRTGGVPIEKPMQ
jgi:transposase